MLVTGKLEWTDPETGEVEITHEDWSTRWQIAGWPSYNWWWVRKYGKMGCGCTRNPITRKRVLTAMGCDTHAPAKWFDDLFEEADFF